MIRSHAGKINALRERIPFILEGITVILFSNRSQVRT